MSGGGSSGGGQQVQDNSIQLEQMRQAEAARARQEAEAKLAREKTEFQENLSRAVAGGRTTGTNALVNRGSEPVRQYHRSDVG